MAKGTADRVRARHFHNWCRQQLVAYRQKIPGQGGGMFDPMVDNVINGVKRKQIPFGLRHLAAPQWRLAHGSRSSS